MTPSGAAQTITYTTTDSQALEAVHAGFERALADVRARLGEDHPMRIGGRAHATGAWLEDRSPSDPAVIVARVPSARVADVDLAVAEARQAFPGWSRRPWRERLALLRRAADLIEQEAAELAAWLALEAGKTRLEAFGEASELPTLIRYYCDQVEAADGFARPERRVGDERAQMLLRPYGVWAVISPFNFPLATGAGMAAGALAAGNVVVMKPATDAPLLTLRFVDALERAGLPPGVAAAITGSAAAVGEALVAHPGIDGIAFTGSVPTGMAIARALAEGSVRRPFIGEMGGKNPVIVARSADLDDAVEGVVRSAFGFSGQKCSATSRVYAVGEAYEPFLERLVARVRTLAAGDPTERATFVGPVINAAAVDRFTAAVDTAKRAGSLLAGGARSPRLPGYLLEPTVVAGLPLDHPLFRQELFLPFLVVGRVPDLATAIRESNATEFGLCAGLFSRDEAEIARFFDEVEAGVLYANRRAGATSGAWPGVQAFTGWKASGSSGKGALGPWYVQQFMREQVRTVVER